MMRTKNSSTRFLKNKTIKYDLRRSLPVKITIYFQVYLEIKENTSMKFLLKRKPNHWTLNRLNFKRNKNQSHSMKKKKNSIHH